MRTVSLPEEALPATLGLNPDLHMSDDEFYEFCMANPDLWLERTAEGQIVVSPSSGLEHAYRSSEASGQLHEWAKLDGRGKGFGATSLFMLPTGAAYSPDAAWVSNDPLARLTKEQRRKFPPVCPEFVIEIISPSDRFKPTTHKMEEWIRAGVELGWLIYPDKRTVFIYRAGQKGAEERVGIMRLAGEGPVAGFELDLTDIWKGL